MPANSARQPHCGARLCMCMYLRLHSACICRMCCTCRMRCMRRQRRWPRGNAAARVAGSLPPNNRQPPTANCQPTMANRQPAAHIRLAPLPAMHGHACRCSMCTRHAQKLAQPHLPAPLAPEPPHQRKYPPSRPQPHLALHDRAMRLHRQQSVARDAMPCLAHACASAATRLAPSTRNPLNHLGQPGIYCQCFQRCQRQSARAPVRPACLPMLRPFANARLNCLPSRINTGFPERCKPAAASRICASQFQRMVST